VKVGDDRPADRAVQVGRITLDCENDLVAGGGHRDGEPGTVGVGVAGAQDAPVQEGVPQSEEGALGFPAFATEPDEVFVGCWWGPLSAPARHSRPASGPAAAK